MVSSLGLRRGTVRLVPYRRAWHAAFIQESRKLRKMLGSSVIEIQHVGSTAVSGLRSKPILDIDVGLKSLPLSKKVKAKLRRLGYLGPRTKSRSNIVFVKGPEHRRTIYLHLMLHNGRIWKNDLRFRNWLRESTAHSREYERVKVALWRRNRNNRARYTLSKGKFIKRVLAGK